MCTLSLICAHFHVEPAESFLFLADNDLLFVLFLYVLVSAWYSVTYTFYVFMYHSEGVTGSTNACRSVQELGSAAKETGCDYCLVYHHTGHSEYVYIVWYNTMCSLHYL